MKESEALDPKISPGRVLWGVLAAFFCPGFYMMFFGFIISWKEMLPGATSFQQAISHAGMGLFPFMLGVALFGSVVILPSLYVWRVLHRARRVSPIGFSLVGLGAGLVLPTLLLAVSLASPPDAYLRSFLPFYLFQYALAGAATGFTLWLFAYWKPGRRLSGTL